MSALKNLPAKFLFLVAAISAAASSFAIDAPSRDPIAVTDFVNEALIASTAQIESAQLALQQSPSPEIKEFAQLVIDERTAANEDLNAITQKKRLKVISGNELSKRAKALTLKPTTNEFFDKEYVQNQIKARQDEIELFNKGALSKDPELAGFATENIPKLTHNLHLAETLAKEFEKK